MKDLSVHMRWLIHRDIHDVVEIEKKCFPIPWSEENFLTALRVRNNIAIVAEVEDQIVGYVIYELHKTRLHLINIAVHPDSQRKGVGSLIVNSVIGKLSAHARQRITLFINERNVSGQLFFKSVGFRATVVEKDFFDNGDDAYRMQYRLLRESGVAC